VAYTVRGTQRGFDRLVFFSDAVVAIAITLLILPLVDSVTSNKDVGHLLHQQGGRFLAFVLSFFVIARFWFAHHALFERIDKYDTALLWANMAWLASIVFLPFPTELLSVRGTDEATVRFVYIASVLAISALLLVLQVVMRRSPQLWLEGQPFDYPLTGSVITVLLLIAALIIGTTVAAINMWAMLLLLLSGPLEGLINRKRAARHA
jgi:uncharacterized membrane protein